jgi:hypothetical protein
VGEHGHEIRKVTTIQELGALLKKGFSHVVAAGGHGRALYRLQTRAVSM